MKKCVQVLTCILMISSIFFSCKSTEHDPLPADTGSSGKTTDKKPAEDDSFQNDDELIFDDDSEDDDVRLNSVPTTPTTPSTPEPPKETTESQDETKQSTSIGIPTVKKSQSYFYPLSNDIVALVENGTPESIRKFYSSVYRTVKTDYTKQERVLLEISSAIMSSIWKSETLSMNYPEVDFSNPYTAAIDSAKKGIFDTSTGNSDFFTNLLPALVLFSGSSRTDYYQNAETFIERAIALNPESVLANYMMGVLKIRMGKTSESISYLSKAHTNYPSGQEIHYVLGTAYFYTKQYEKSLLQAEKLLAGTPLSTDYLYLAARSALKIKDYDKAESYTLKLLQIQPENSDYILLRSRILVEKGEYMKASSILDSYSKKRPANAEYLLLKSIVQKNWNKNYNNAADLIGKAMELSPNDEEVLLVAAQIASDSGNKIGGLTSLELAEKVLTLSPGKTEALEVCIVEMIKQKKYSDAYNMSSKLIAEKKNSTKVNVNHVDICIALGLKEEAWNLAESMYEKDPKNEDNIKVHMKVLIATDKKSQALALFKELEPTSSSAMKSFLYYEKSLIDTDTDTILSDLRTSLTYNARNIDSLYSMYKIYYGQRNWKLAQYYLKQVLAITPNDPDIIAKSTELEILLGK